MEEIKSSDITTAIAKVGKTFNPKVFLQLMEKFEVKIAELQHESVGIEVKDTDTEQESIELAITVKSLNKVIDNARMGAKRPYLDFGKELDSYVRPSQKSLELIENFERSKCMGYRDRLLKLREAAEAKERKDAADDAAKAAKAARAAKAETVEVSETDHALNRLNAPIGNRVMNTPEKTVQSFAGGSGSYDIVNVPHLTDISKVPAKYLMVDWKKVKADVKDGILNIPGFEIKKENKMTLRRG